MIKKMLPTIIGGLLLLLIGTNIVAFMSGMQLSEKIQYYEQETKRLQQENTTLEQKAYQANSLQHAASMAAVMDFTKKAQPMYLQQIGYAFKR